MDGRVGKLLLQDWSKRVHSCVHLVGSAAPAALHFLFALRRLIQGCPVVVMVTMPAHHIQQQQRALLYRSVWHLIFQLCCLAQQ